MKTLRLTVPLLGLLLLSACADLPKFDTSQVDKSLLPTHVSSDLPTTRGKTVMWGGTILSSKNLKDATRLEVLAYPLDEDGWPQREQKPLGRFMLTQKGYLETADYAQGRVITVIGIVTGTQQGKIGDTAYTYPLIQAQQLHLWRKGDRKSNTGVHFGIGVIFH